MCVGSFLRGGGLGLTGRAPVALEDIDSVSNFFSLQINLNRPCPFWPDDGSCSLKDCSVKPCTEVCPVIYTMYINVCHMPTAPSLLYLELEWPVFLVHTCKDLALSCLSCY